MPLESEVWKWKGMGTNEEGFKEEIKFNLGLKELGRISLSKGSLEHSHKENRSSQCLFTV